MLNSSFENAFGLQSTLQNECSNSKIEVSPPEFEENSEIYQKLKDICADPQALLDLLNIQIVNHVRSGSPEHYNNFELSQMLNPFFSILPSVLSNRSIIAQTHQVIINVREFLSHWQNFSFQCFYSYFYQILSSKIYIGKPRKWIINTVFDLLSQNKPAYSYPLVARVHAKDKQFKDKSLLHAVIYPDKRISIYYQNTCLKRGILNYVPSDDFPIHQIVEMNDKKEITYKSRITFLDSNGEKVTSDSVDHFFNEGNQIYHLIWACLSCKRNEFSFEAIDAISRMIFELKGAFLHIFYYSQKNEALFRSLFITSVFIHRHPFLYKTLIWAIYDEATDKNKLFKSTFPAVRYLISFVRIIIKYPIFHLINEVIQFIDMYELDVDSSHPNDPLNDDLFKHQLINKFWQVLLQVAKTFPKSLFDICYELKIYYDLYQQNGQSNLNVIKDLLMSEVIIPALFESLQKAGSKNQKDCLNFVNKSITLTAASNKDDKFSRLGFQPLQEFLDFLSQNPQTYNIKDVKMPLIQEYTDAVLDLVDCIRGSVEYLRKSLLCNETDCDTCYHSLDDSESSDMSQNQLPTTRTRTSRISTGNQASLKEAEGSVNHLQSYKEIPADIFPWKCRISRDIFYSYYIQNSQNQ